MSSFLSSFRSQVNFFLSISAVLKQLAILIAYSSQLSHTLGIGDQPGELVLQS